jgi:hypothetical protein
MGVGCDILFKIFEMGVGGRLACVAGSLVNYVIAGIYLVTNT